MSLWHIGVIAVLVFFAGLVVQKKYPALLAAVPVVGTF